MARFLRHAAEIVRVLIKGESGLKARIMEMDAEAARVSPPCCFWTKRYAQCTVLLACAEVMFRSRAAQGQCIGNGRRGCASESSILDKEMPPML